MANTMLQELQNFFDSPEGEAYMIKFKADQEVKEARRQNNKTRIKRFYHNQETFNILMKRICDKHNSAYEDRCYDNGCQPYPMEILNTVHDIAECEGQDYESLDSFTENFPSQICTFMNWQFAVTHGQGSVLSVYQNRELLVRL
jgi:hypothetical protein